MTRYSVIILIMLFLFFALSPPGEAKSEESFNPLRTLGKRIGQAWESDKYDLYLPVNNWHNRFMYDSDYRKEKGYNELPWGLGVGRYFLDEDLDTHGLNLLGFKDSNHKFQYIGGYVFLKNWYFDEKKDWSAGLGFTLSLTGRHEYDYIPLPLLCPFSACVTKNLPSRPPTSLAPKTTPMSCSPGCAGT